MFMICMLWMLCITKCASVNFCTRKQVPVEHEHEMSTSKRAKVGQPKHKERKDAFLEVTEFLEHNDDEQITINDLICHMEVNPADSRHDAYSYVHMQKKLKEHFGYRIIETEINGKPNVVTFRSKAKTILHDYYNHRNADPDIEKK